MFFRISLIFKICWDIVGIIILVYFLDWKTEDECSDTLIVFSGAEYLVFMSLLVGLLIRSY
jgi:hypothetical protein